MFLKKRLLATLAVITAVLLLGACGGKDTSSDNPVNDSGGSQDGSPNDILPISEGLEEYAVWFKTSENPGRDTYVSSMYVFENGKVTISNLDLPIEDIINLTDDEILQYAKENSTLITEGKYTLDITLDRLGQNTEKISVLLAGGMSVRTQDLEGNLEEAHDHGMSKEEYVDFINAENAGKTTYTIEGEKLIENSKIEDGKDIVTFSPDIVNQQIFETVFSGLALYEDDEVLLTRVNDSFAGFKVDSPDTKKKNVTIEGK